MPLPVVAVVGRPNVGKSTLFNKLIGQRLSIVEDTPGVTRDRIYSKCEWRGRKFMVVDTGGIEPKEDDKLLTLMRQQAEIAISHADVIILVTDVRCGVTANDYAVAEMLQKSGKPVVLCVNKCDTLGETPMEVYEFYNLGLGDPYPVSSVHGHGTGDMLDEVVKHFPENDIDDYDEDDIKVAVIGKPNAGKSSLINRIAGEERVIVSDIAGTTRDAIDTRVVRNGQEYVFIDTAGLRRKAKVKEDIERFSTVRTVAAIERADVVVCMIDATEGVTEQDAKICGIAHEKGKGLIIAVNKWDAIEKNDKTIYRFSDDVKQILSFAPYAEIIYISAKTGQRVNKLFDCIETVIENQNLRISTGVLNEIMAEAAAMQQPPSDKGRRLKLFYITQVGVKPPTFVIFVNDKKLMHFSYTRYLENRIRDSFGFSGTPLRFFIRERKEKDQA